MKVVVFGAGNFGKRYCQNAIDSEVLAVADNNNELWGKYLFGHLIISPQKISEYDYDYVVTAIEDQSEPGMFRLAEITAQLKELNIDDSKILFQHVFYEFDDPRVTFVRKLAECLNVTESSGMVAECGVFHGDFAAWINEYFPDKKLYLFDTFTGFDERDIQSEPNKKAFDWVTSSKHMYINASEKYAIMKCLHRENVIIKKGFVPDTFKGMENETFVFVNLDMDLYSPQLAALRFFIPRMCKGGVILIHDYYASDLPGVKQAVDECAAEWDFSLLSIGDELSIALIPYNTQ